MEGMGLISFKRKHQGPDLFRAEMEKRGRHLVPYSRDPRGRARAGGSRTGSSRLQPVLAAEGRLLGKEVWVTKGDQWQSLRPLP